MKMSTNKYMSSNNGSTLIVALIMLIMVTLIVIMSFNISDSNLKIVANAQNKQRTMDAAEFILNDSINTINQQLTSDPCNINTLKSSDGSFTKTVDGINIDISRTLIQVIPRLNNYYTEKWNNSLSNLEAAKANQTSVCTADSSSSSCAAANSEVSQLQKEALSNEQTVEQCVSSTDVTLEDPETTSGSSSNESYCVDVVMELRAEAVDSISNAKSSIVRGISLVCSNHEISK